MTDTSVTPTTSAPDLPILTGTPTTPAWLSHGLSVALVLVPVILAIAQPNGAFAGAAGPAIVAAGILAAALIHLVWLIGENGLTRAGLERTVSEEEAWLQANWTTIASVFGQAKTAVESIPGVPGRLAGVESAITDLRARVDAVPATSRQAALDALANLVVPAATAPVTASPNMGQGTVTITQMPPSPPAQ